VGFVNYPRHVRVETEDLVSPTEAAELIGLKNVGGVSTYRARYDDFPKPVLEKGRCVLWLRQDIERWAARHRD
jgi:hypothetical protein